MSTCAPARRLILAILWAAAVGAASLTAAARAAPQSPAQDPEPPEILFGDLFVAVQMQHVFADGKEFVDAVPKSDPAEILRSYHEAMPRTAEALRAFVEAHFALPASVVAEPAPTTRIPITEHIDGLWAQLTRSTPQVPPYSSALALPRPYVVPGGRFRELYYWDSYFTMLGLAESGRLDRIVDMVGDFAYLIDRYGHVPNGARTYYLSRSQPPFFFAMVGLLSPEDPAKSFARYLPELRREYAYWMEGADRLHPGHAHRHVVALPDGAILNRYWDDRDTPRDESYAQDVAVAARSGRVASEVFRELRAAAESGWDFSSRWFSDARDPASIETTEIIPVDLNSLLFGLEGAIHDGCERAAVTTCAQEFSRRAAIRRAAIDRYLWDGARGAYLDYRWTSRARVARVSAATLYPLFLSLASRPQAESVAGTVSRQLLKPGGIVATPLETGQQWDSPNGWAPLEWIAIAGLRRYGKDALAEMIACRWMTNVSGVYRRSGKLVEKYDVIRTDRMAGGGEYPTQDGFGWSNGVMRELVRLYPADAGYSDVARCR